MAEVNVSLEYPEHKNLIVESLWKCLVERELLDLVFICDKNIKVFAHKLVLAIVSPFLSNIINVSSQDVVYISVPDVDHNKLRMLMNFLYEGVTRVTYEDMAIIRELMILLDIQTKNSEIKSVTPQDSFTPIFMKNTEEIDPLTVEHSPQSVQTISPCIVPKVESNTDCYEVNNIDLASFSGNTNMLPGDTVNTDLLNQQTEDTDNTEGHILESKVDIEENMENYDENMDNEENESEGNDDNFSNDIDFVGNINSDIESVVGATPHKTQSTQYATRIAASYECSDDITVNHVTTLTKDSTQSSVFISVGEISDQNTECSFIKEDEDYQIPDMNLPANNVMKYGQEIDINVGNSALACIEDFEVMKHQQKRNFKLTSEKRKILEDEYKYNKRPTEMEMLELAKELKVDSDMIISWYKNKRKNDFSGNEKTEERYRQKESVGYDIEANTEDSQDSKYSYESSDSKRSGRNKIPWFITSYQKETLEAEYRKEKFPSKEVLKRLENSLKLPFMKLKMWFASRRYRDSSGSSTRRRIAVYPSRLSEEQKEILEACFMKQKRPTEEVLEILQKELHLPSHKIKNWFNNRIYKYTSESTEYIVPDENVVEEESYNTENISILNESVTDVDMKTGRHKPDNMSVNLRHRSFEQTSTMFLDKKSSNQRKIRFNEQQKIVLENAYIINKYPDYASISEIASTLGATNKSVNLWFRSKRVKEKEGNISMKRSHRSSEQTNAMFLDKKSSSQPKIRFNERQKVVLEIAYIKNKYPDYASISKIASTLSVTDKSVNLWFRNKRVKEREDLQSNKHSFQEESQPLFRVNKTERDTDNFSNGSNTTEFISCVDNMTTLIGDAMDTNLSSEQCDQDIQNVEENIDKETDNREDTEKGNHKEVTGSKIIDEESNGKRVLRRRCSVKENSEKMEDSYESDESQSHDMPSQSLQSLSGKKRKKKTTGIDNAANFSCETCCKSFISSKSRNRHNCLIYKKHKCDFCDASFDRRDHCNKHMRIHSGGSLFKCDKCSYSFYHKKKLKLHLITHHRGMSLQSVPSLSGKKRKKRITVNAAIFSCDTCGKNFISSKSRNRHDCSIYKKHKCDYCDASFDRRDLCNKHMRIHSGGSLFKCDKCSYSFYHKEKLKSHFITHHGGGHEPVKFQHFTKEQKAFLERNYKNNPTVSREERERLALELNCSYERVRIWFSNRKAKDKKDEKDTNKEQIQDFQDNEENVLLNVKSETGASIAGDYDVSENAASDPLSPLFCNDVSELESVKKENDGPAINIKFES